MSCKQYLDALTEVALGGLQGEALRAHLADCPACRVELERLRALTGAMDRSITGMAHAEPSLGFAARVRARIAEESAARAAWWRGWVPALAGAVAVLALVAWLLWPADVQVPAPAHEFAGPSKGAQPLPTQVEPLPVEKPAPPQQRTAGSIPRRNLQPAAKREAKPALPEVLISGDEWNQVVKLYALAQRGQVNAETAAPADATPLEDKFQPLAIAHLQPIPPLGEPPPASEPRK